MVDTVRVQVSCTAGASHVHSVHVMPCLAAQCMADTPHTAHSSVPSGLVVAAVLDWGKHRACSRLSERTPADTDADAAMG